MTSQPEREQPFIARALGRLRHGLVVQEILDRLARLGIIFYPYVVYREWSDAPLPNPPQIPEIHLLLKRYPCPQPARDAVTSGRR